MRERLESALRAVGAGGDLAPLYDELVARHGEAHRAYHDLTHVRACLEHLDRFAALAARPAEVELALWFHDAIYDPRAKDNEARSAELARERLGALGVDAAVVERIARHVEATASHDAADDPDTALVVDVDLSILGADVATYDQFEQAIRAEYAFVPEADFRAGRRAVLERFAARAQLYETPALRDAFESAARANLARALRAL